MGTTRDDRHTITYRVLNHDLSDPMRDVEVHASPAEIDHLVCRGYLLRERLFAGDELRDLRAALDDVEAREKEAIGVSMSRRFGGLFLRHLMDKDEAFLRLLNYPPTLSIARAVLGPLVQVRGLSARISYPGADNQPTHWHGHHRVLSDPLPRFFCPPQALDCLIYLDELNDPNGPVCILPGSHLRHTVHPDGDDHADVPGQVAVRAPAGTCVIIHSSLWRRAMPTPAGWGEAPAADPVVHTYMDEALSVRREAGERPGRPPPGGRRRRDAGVVGRRRVHLRDANATHATDPVLGA
ncbi:hypothetical protein HN371_25450 [Candidatus Poribacteria bacterium]|nr:hypothetical protein [Candidatus Poribacteria bacterium]MBT7100116.1 hypothetical protein [Candidatus Poribacteria bacterium]MBT7809129.1 hypothetical protein [Candidatus Poribacteria bacterium]